MDNANLEAERRRRALKSQGTNRPIKNARRAHPQNVNAAQNPAGEDGADGNINSNEMTIHEIISIQRVEQAGQKTQR